ncbi:MAG: hypothetical protein GOMPHAMPRED_005328 [Gomphillus americanus]|uniref:Uncharacterized protein n=1 Tax=Gomphillus americanus TaxID=1940652 RepID=A0A8H3FQU8_9LECA|nr:MAG: hypothetical protein GOMPHAMPRED_005328 [Gomphillus americanus]
MTNLSSSAYTQCGNAGSCCPLGYLCNNGGCIIDNQLASPSSVSGSSGANTATQTSLPSSTQTLFPASATSKGSSFPSSSAAAAGATNNPAATSTPSGPQFPIEAILVGLFPGLVAGCIISFLIVCCLGRRRTRERFASESSSSLGPTVAKISDPIYDPDQSTTRTDFLRQQSCRIAKKASHSILGRGNTNDSPASDSSIQRMRSLFRKASHSPMTPDNSHQWTRNPTHLNHLSEHNMPDPSSAAERALHDRIGRSDTISTGGGPRTPRREPSMESIPIYNNTPDARGYERNTVFADLLPAVSMRSAENQGFQGTHGRKASAGPMPPMFLGSPLDTGR